MAYRPDAERGAFDSNYKMCNAQAVPTDGADDYSLSWINLIDTAPNLRGTGEVILKVMVTTKISVASGSSSKMYINLATEATDSTPSTEIAKALITLGYNNAAGKIYEAAVPRRAVQDFMKYVGLVLEPVGDDTLYSAGAITAWLDFN